jgi:hypothetical protein
MPGFFSRSLLICCLLLSVACSENTIFRDAFKQCTVTAVESCDNAAIAIHGAGTDEEFQLGFIEYDDQGQLRDRQQMQVVLDTYYPIAGQDDVILTVFAHGWHHSAKPGDTNIESFKEMLQKISASETTAAMQDERKKRKVLGVYIGWRGDSMSVKYLNSVTFWGRKSVAHEVGQQGVTEALLRLEEIVNVRAGFEVENPKPLNSRMVVIGHSFGGAVIFTSLQQVMADRFLDSRRGKTYQSTAKGFGDLVVLMNPAFEAMRYSTLFDISQSCGDNSCRKYMKNQMPRLAVLTSEGDIATGMAFPAGRVFSTMFETHDNLERYIETSDGREPVQINESKADTTTIGHFEPYWTHTLEPLASSKSRDADFVFRSLGNDWSQQTYGERLDFEHVSLKHLDRSHPLNPYLNIYVSKELIPDHNKIWGDRVIGFIEDLITISTTPDLSYRSQ